MKISILTLILVVSSCAILEQNNFKSRFVTGKNLKPEEITNLKRYLGRSGSENFGNFKYRVQFLTKPYLKRFLNAGEQVSLVFDQLKFNTKYLYQNKSCFEFILDFNSPDLEDKSLEHWVLEAQDSKGKRYKLEPIKEYYGNPGWKDRAGKKDGKWYMGSVVCSNEPIDYEPAFDILVYYNESFMKIFNEENEKLKPSILSFKDYSRKGTDQNKLLDQEKSNKKKEIKRTFKFKRRNG